MNHTFRKEGDILILALENLLNPTENQAAIKTLEGYIEEGVTHVIVDLVKMKFVNSTGLGFLISTLTRTRNAGGETVLANVNNTIRKLIFMVKLQTMFDIYDDVDTAILGIQGKPTDFEVDTQEKKPILKVDVILGLQWGDEGKGKIVDFLAKDYDIVARFQGGPNAGHTLKFDGRKHVLHTVPSGIFRQNLINIIGNGVVIDPITLRKEIQKLDEVELDYKNRLLISRKAHLILPTHRLLDAGSEAAKGAQKIGSTLKGIGPTYMDKTGRNGLRVGDLESPNFQTKYNTLKKKHLSLAKLFPEVDFDLEKEEKAWMESIELIRSFTKVNGEYYIQNAIKQGKKVLAEGAQGSMLDIDFGTYPFVTSSNTITAGVCTGLGIAPNQIGEVIGITKAYCTRVGSGPFPTELDGEVGERLRAEGQEFGATTGRPRRCGWIDLPQLKYTIMLNGVTQLTITKIDILNHFENFKAAIAYDINNETTEELPFDLNDQRINPVYRSFDGWNQSLDGVSHFDDMPTTLQSYIAFLERHLECPITMVSTGPERKKLIIKSPAMVSQA